jgi:hypothetical protein
MGAKEPSLRRIRILFLLVIALTAVSLPAEAHGGRGRVSVGVGVGFGPAFWYPGWYYPPYYSYYPPYYYPQVVTAQPTEYIERGDAAAEESRGSQEYWYYCKESRAYHPYVKHCPGGWEKQIPAPAPGG